MLFAEDERHVGLYQTPVGAGMTIATHTSRVRNTVGEDGGELVIDVEVRDGAVERLLLTGPTNVVAKGEVTDEELAL